MVCTVSYGMNINSLLTTRKPVYILVGGIVLIFFVIVVLILRNISGGEGRGRATLEFWGVYDSRQDFTDVISSFKKSEPNIQINYKQFSYDEYEKSLVDALAAGTGPDILMIHHTWLGKHQDKLASMPDKSRIKDFKFMTLAEFQSQFVDVAYQDLVAQNKIYALPLYADTLALFYNKDMLNTAGIAQPPQNWEDFNKDVELLTKLDGSGNITQSGAAIGTARNINRSTDIIAALMIQNGTQMTDKTNETVSFTRPVSGEKVGENALQYYTDFSNPLKPVYAWNDQQHYSIDAFVEEKVAMMFNYSHQIPVLSSRYQRLNFAIAPLPQFSQLDARNYANYWAVGVSAQSKNQDVAWRFLTQLTSKEGSLSYLGKTSRPSARRDIIDIQKNDLKLGVFAVQALSAKSWFQIDNRAIDQVFADMIDEVNSKRATVRAALREAESKINTLMSRKTQ